MRFTLASDRRKAQVKFHGLWGKRHPVAPEQSIHMARAGNDRWVGSSFFCLVPALCDNGGGGLGARRPVGFDLARLLHAKREFSRKAL